jgi:hypothetical protein
MILAEKSSKISSCVDTVKQQILWISIFRKILKKFYLLLIFIAAIQPLVHAC